jgi:phosphate transport system permease protein
MMKHWIKSGEPWVWMNAAAVSISLLAVAGLLGLIAYKGMAHFWPADVVQMNYQVPGQAAMQVIGEIRETETVPASALRDAGNPVDASLEYANRSLIKTGNRDLLGSDFRWIIESFASEQHAPEALMVVERREWGNLYGYLESISESGVRIKTGGELQERIDRVDSLHEQIRDIEKNSIGSINYKMEDLRLERRRLELDNVLSQQALQQIEAKKANLQTKYEQLQKQLNKLYNDIDRDSMGVRVMDGQLVNITLAKVVHAYRPNAMSVFGKTGFYIAKFWEFLADEPREANTEGGIFPALFGTVMMVVLMSVMVMPFGVIAAVYLHEYAKQGLITRVIRVAVNNLAGVPSIVYGVFGLGFFVYMLGGSLDKLFYPEASPSPVFGTPGLLWSSLTLALLTVPVVIVATEEGLARIPKALREGSLALGATQAETLWRTVIPMATPAIMTGLILAVARAAGEVAPLMLVGVVKLAPSLPLDGNFPFVHLERKFMHLGFHIYDVGFQSPNVEAARPLVYATAFILVLVIVLLNIAAISIRNRLRERYRGMDN